MTMEQPEPSNVRLFHEHVHVNLSRLWTEDYECNVSTIDIKSSASITEKLCYQYPRFCFVGVLIQEKPYNPSIQPMRAK